MFRKFEAGPRGVGSAVAIDVEEASILVAMSSSLEAAPGRDSSKGSVTTVQLLPFQT